MIIEAILIAFSLSLDTLAVTMCSSMSLGHITFGKTARTASAFALIQSIFIIGGWILGFGAMFFIENIAPYIALALLLYIGGNMAVGGVKDLAQEKKKGKVGNCECEDQGGGSVNLSSIPALLLAGVATSIDAAAVGASMAMGGVKILDMTVNTIIVFVVTALVAASGITSGTAIGHRFGHYASIVGGLVLISIGVNIAFL